MKKLLLFFILVGHAALAQIPTNGLLVHYPFSGNTNDASGNNVTMSTVNATLATDRNGGSNGAYQFSAANSNRMEISYATYPDLMVTTAFTISAWIRPTATATQFPTIIEFGKVFLRLEPLQGRIVTGYYDGTTYRILSSGNNAYVLDKWQHVAVTFANQFDPNGVFKIYLNGNVISSSDFFYPPGVVYSITDEFLAIGSGSPASTSKYFTGRIDEVAIYNRALSGSEVRGLMEHNTLMPAVLTHPQGGSVCSTSNVNLSVTANEYTTTYRWQKNGVAISDNAKYSGTATPNLTISDFAVTDNGTYTCRVGNEAAEVVSNGAVLTVATVPNLTITNNSGTLSVTSASSYQWIYNGNDIPGATNQTTPVIGDGTYQVRVTTPENCSYTSPVFLNYQTPNIIPTHGLLSYYPLDGNGDDYSGNFYDAHLVSATAANDRNSVANASMRFASASSNQIKVNLEQHQALKVSNSFTLSAWATISATNPTYPTIMEIGESVFMRFQNQNGFLRVGVGMRNSSGYVTYVHNAQVNLNTWYHMAMTYDGAVLKTYLDGVLISTQNTGPVVYTASDSVLTIGAGAHLGGIKFHNGSIDNVAIYGRALEVSEIAMLKDYTGVPVIVYPDAEISQHPVNSTFCEGSTASLSVVALNAVNYQWYRNGNALSNGSKFGGVTTSNLQVFNFADTDLGSYTCRAYNRAGDFVTSNAATLSLPTVEVPVVSFNNGQLSTTAYASYQWIRDGQDIAGQTSQSFTLVNNGDYQVRITNGLGCSFTSSVYTYAMPLPVITQQPQEAIVCSLNDVTLSIAATNATSYQWFKNGQSITSGFKFSGVTTLELTIYDFTSADNGIYTCRAYNESGYTASNNASVTLAPEENPVISITVDGLTTGSYASYLWFFNGNMIVDGNTQAITANNDGIYRVRVTNAQGCEYYSADFPYYPNTPAPVITQHPSDATVCQDETFTLHVGASNAASYQWLKDGQPVSNGSKYFNVNTAALQIFDFSPDDAGAYSCSVSNVSGTVVSDAASLSFAARPLPTISLVSGVLETQNFASYQWFYDGFALDNSNTNTWTPTWSGIYYVSVTSSDNCTAVSGSINYQPTSVRNGKNKSLSFFPNPTTDFITVPDNKAATIYDTMGNIVVETTSSERIDVSKLGQGMYIIEINNAAGISRELLYIN